MREKEPVPEPKDVVKETRIAEKETRERLEEAALTDFLTGIPNRRGFFEKANTMVARLPGAMAERRREGSIEHAAFALFDVDNFKQINDAYGHDVGDEVLKQVALLLQQTFPRAQDVVARYGGEEFVVGLEGAQADEILTKRLGLDIAAGKDATLSFTIHLEGGKELPVTLSGGITEFHPGEMVSQAIYRADQAMYFSKQHGKNKIVEWNPGMEPEKRES